MSRTINRRKLMDACIEAISIAEQRYAAWTGGVTMRAAPESLVQTVIAEQVAGLGGTLLLEASVGELIERATGDRPKELPRNERGRIDLAIYYKSRKPRLVVEVKKVDGRASLNDDHSRILELLLLCPSVQHGVLVGYTTAVNSVTVLNRLNAIQEETGARIIRRLEPTEVQSRSGTPRFLGAAVYRVDRE